MHLIRKFKVAMSPTYKDVTGMFESQLVTSISKCRYLAGNKVEILKNKTFNGLKSLYEL